jgi:hypothetical protein
MNYKFQFTGISDCSLNPVGRGDYSHGTRRVLNENDLYEPDGVCMSPERVTSIDWNFNSQLDFTHYARDLNPQFDANCYSVHVFHDYNDWTAAQLDRVRYPSPEVSDVCADVPL